MRNRFLRAAILLAVVLMVVGCHQPVTPPSTDATLASLSVSGYTLNPTFSNSVTSYTLLVEKSVDNVTIAAAANDSGATVAWDHNPATTQLAKGPNVFKATVTAADGTTTKTYTVTVYKANMKVNILDSVNGSAVPAGGSVSVYSSGTLLYTAAMTTNPQEVWVGTDAATYTIKATPTGRAQSSKENIAGVDDQILTMISQKLDMNTFPAEAPTIKTITYTSADDPSSAAATWLTPASGDMIDFSTVKYIKVVVTGKSEMDSTSWAGFGVKMGIDQVPSTFSGMVPDQDLSSSTYDSTAGLFTGTAVFDCTGMSFTAGSHTFSFVIYDRANNRVERSFALFNTSVLACGSDISSDYFQSLLADLRIYGVTREYFGKGKSSDGLVSLGTGPISYRAAITFKFQTASSGGSAVPILGFTVYRSEDDGLTWAQVGAVNYGALSTGSAGTHTFYDTDSGLEVGTAYKYKVVVFTDNCHKKESAVMGPVKLLPAFTASLAAPANKSKQIDASNLPNFEFTISDPSLWDVNVSDAFYFSPVIRRADGQYVYIGLFYYIFSSQRLAFYYPAGGGYYLFSVVDTADLIQFDSTTGTVSLSPDLFYSVTNYATGGDLIFNSGATYEWDIFGNYTGNASTNTAAYFQKSGTGSVSRSYADVYQNGQQTLNGWFSFTVK